MLILTGQTACGKSAVAVCLAKATGAEIISVDSMKVYRGLDIGTAKPSLVARDGVVFHMVDVADQKETFTLASYVRAAQATRGEIVTRGRIPLFVGGTPLYLRGLLYGIFEGPGANWDLRKELLVRAEREGSAALHAELCAIDPVSAARLHPNDLSRIVRALEVVRVTGRPISEHQRQYPAPQPAVVFYRMVVLRRAEEDLRARINRRTERMFASGLVDEVGDIMRRGGLNRSAQKAIGYREVLLHLRGDMDLAETIECVKRNTWRMARKQMTWFRRFPGVLWIDVLPEERPEEISMRARGKLFDQSLN